MLTVAKITGTGAVGYADYLEGKATATPAGDYYLKDGERVEAPGRWAGGATAVGADAEAAVAGEQLRTLMEVRRPDTGAPLRPAGATGEIVVALDATFSAPKSVSAAWALADSGLRAQIEQAHETAIDRALRYATAQVAMVRERLGRNTVIHAKARELVATSWRHTTARAVGDQPPDPQLHSHVLLHGAVRRDGRVVAIDSRRWLVHRRELGAAYRTELARELHYLGYEIRQHTGRGRRYFELASVPQELIDRWSSRDHQVREAIQARLETRRAELQATIDRGGVDGADARARLARLDRSGQLPAAEDRLLRYASRSRKSLATRGDLDHHWTHTAHDLGVTTVGVRRDPSHPREPLTVDPATLLAALTEHDATLTRPQARAIALEHTAGLPIHDALTHLAQMRDDGQLLTLAGDSLTTSPHRARERATATAAARLAFEDIDPLPRPLVAHHAQRLDDELQVRGGGLSDEQRAALELASSDRQLVVIEGQAGTGKSTVLTGIARAHHDAGQQIIVTSTAALAAQRLADELTTAGVPVTAHSTAGLLHHLDQGRLILDPATTIIHDEAALASTRELDPLLAAAEESGARVILVGDPRQSHPVGAGGLWPEIEHAAGMHGGRVELARNLRAQDPNDASDQHHFRTDESLAALEGYAARGRVHLHTTQAGAEDAALDAAHEDRQVGRRTLVLAQTSNDHLDQLNARAQAIRLQAGELGSESLPVAGRPYRLRRGDDIQLRATIPHPDLGQLRNGTTATITNVEPAAETATLRLSDDREATLSHQELDAAQARLAYVQHPFPAQGTTTDTTHLIAAEHATREGTYVALTRARHETHIHAGADRLDPDEPLLPQLAEQLSRTEPDLPSIALPLAHEDAISMAHAQETNPRSQSPQEMTSAMRSDDNVRPGAHRLQPAHSRAAASPGPEPVDEQRSPAPHRGQAAVAAYRDRYGIPADEPTPLGSPPPAGAFQQRLDRRHAAEHALAALNQQQQLTDRDRELQQQLRDATRPSPERTAGWER